MTATTLSEVTCYQRSNGKKLNETFANLLLVFAIAPRGFSSGTLIFQPLTSKSSLPNSDSNRNGGRRAALWI